MTRKEFKNSVDEICKYALFEGCNTNWKEVIKSFHILNGKCIDSGILTFEEESAYCYLLGLLFTIYEREQTFGGDENSAISKLTCIADIYSEVNEWDVV